MTAFATGECSTPRGTLGCEMRAVNHRFLEVAVRLPEELRALEPVLRERVATRLSRGKVDLSMRLRASGGDAALQVDDNLLQRLATLAKQLETRFPGLLQVQLTELLQYPGVLRADAGDAETMQAAALGLLDEVLDQFIAAREREGASLAAVIGERVDAIAAIAGQMRELMPAIRNGQRQKLEARIADLAQPGGIQFEQGRVEQELVLWLQKLDVDEELDRLDSHVTEIRRVLRQREPVGRRLDFLMQEFNRESNTLGSKSVDTRTTNAAVELKVLIDQIREQVQNIE